MTNWDEPDVLVERMEFLIQVLDEQLAQPLGAPLMSPAELMAEVERRRTKSSRAT
jgi:hypothetical protein